MEDTIANHQVKAMEDHAGNRQHHGDDKQPMLASPIHQALFNHAGQAIIAGFKRDTVA